MPATSNESQTLGLHTDLAIESDRTIVERCANYTVVRTPRNPGYHFGNFILFGRAPEGSDHERWPRLFEKHFAKYPAVRHAAFAWSGHEDTSEHVGSFVERGYTYQERAVMTATKVREFAPPQELHIRAFRCDRDWDDQLRLGFATREGRYEREPYEAFKREQVSHHRELTRKSGVWLGAFDGERLAGSCGIFSIGEGVARYQDVGVFPEYRNRGIARSLVGAAGKFAIERFGATTLVIVADAHDFARSIYERAGFTLAQREGALWISDR